ncbi:MAG: hypothetical protein U5Q44_12710 [Dehalococcoidia bacterium]|nr:hypothetical protein [Dehalococcoidia bacterium]
MPTIRASASSPGGAGFARGGEHEAEVRWQGDGLVRGFGVGPCWGDLPEAAGNEGADDTIRRCFAQRLPGGGDTRSEIAGDNGMSQAAAAALIQAAMVAAVPAGTGSDSRASRAPAAGGDSSCARAAATVDKGSSGAGAFPGGKGMRDSRTPERTSTAPALARAKGDSDAAVDGHGHGRQTGLGSLLAQEYDDAGCAHHAGGIRAEGGRIAGHRFARLLCQWGHPASARLGCWWPYGAAPSKACANWSTPKSAP